MKRHLDFAFFGSSLVSAYWNGAATYYRGLIRALAERGHSITFYEPDAYQRQQHRDIADPPWAKVVVYSGTDAQAMRTAVESARGVDVVVKCSGVGVWDAELEALTLELRGKGTRAVFLDVDAPATLARVTDDSRDAFRALIPRYDFVFTYGGGDPVVGRYAGFGAQRCVPIYNALDPATHFPAKPDARFSADLGFLGNRLPDREARVDEFFFRAAGELKDKTFLLGGSGWNDKAMPPNVKHAGHVYTADHNAFNSSTLCVLNVARDSMAVNGFSPGHPRLRGSGSRGLLDHGRVGGDRALPRARQGDPRRARRSGGGADPPGAIPRPRPRHRRGRAQPGARLAHLRCAGTSSGGASPRRRPPPPACRTRGESVTGALDVVVLGLSLSSSWGNGHATTYRALLREVAARGHRVRFFERDLPFYADHRDLTTPSYCELRLYSTFDDLVDRCGEDIVRADVVIVGSYVPEGIRVGRWITEHARGIRAFYDIDTPVTLAALARGECAYLAPEQIADYDLYLSFTGGPTLRILEDRWGSPCARPLYCSVDPGAYFPEPVSGGAYTWELGYLGTYSADRQPTLDTLLLEPARRAPDLHFIVAGPQYPAAIRWPANVERREHLGPAEHRAFYNAQRAALNVTRADMIEAGYSPSVRLFEAAACGTPVVSDTWPGLETLFAPDKEILLARSAAETLSHLASLREERRAAIGAAARARVLAEHTAAHRAESLERYVLESLQGRTRRSAGPRTSGGHLATQERS